MFTIEHEFDATHITLMDDVSENRQGDVCITMGEDTTIIEQVDEETGALQSISLSGAQLRDFLAALNLPEGAYTKNR